MGRPSQRIVWVTGASTGIGKALVSSFVAEGNIVVASSRTSRDLDVLARSLKGEPGTCIPLVCDVLSDRSVRAAVRRILTEFPRVDVLVNNAGVTYFKNFAQTSIEEFDHVLNTNLRGSFLTTHEVLPSMMKRKRGMIVNIQSFAAKTTYTASSIYAASKSGGVAMMNSLREEVRSRGIKVLNVYPGATDTRMWKPADRRRFADVMMTPQDVARKVVEATHLPESMMVEELVIRPQVGDLTV